MEPTGAELVREAAREERESAIDEAWSVGWRGRRYALPRAGAGARLAHRALRLLPLLPGLRWYAAMRALQLRPLRLPKPQVKRGQFPNK